MEFTSRKFLGHTSLINSLSDKFLSPSGFPSAKFSLFLWAEAFKSCASPTFSVILFSSLFKRPSLYSYAITSIFFYVCTINDITANSFKVV